MADVGPTGRALLLLAAFFGLPWRVTERDGRPPLVESWTRGESGAYVRWVVT